MTNTELIDKLKEFPLDAEVLIETFTVDRAGILRCWVTGTNRTKIS
jgi:hypothetical protein